MNAPLNPTAGKDAVAPDYTRAGPLSSDAVLRAQLEDLYARYAACLDAGLYDQWPVFFTEDCTYKLQPRENFERGLPLCTLSFESRGMLRDRVYGITQTLFHQPYYQRHAVSGLMVTGQDGPVILAEANYTVVRTRMHEPSELLSVGRSYDRVVREAGDTAGELRFAARVFVFDNDLIPNSVIYPV